MRLEQIHAKNYRTLQDVRIAFKSNYCTLSGRNNAGKSCFVRLILNLLHGNEDAPWQNEDFAFQYDEDRTQWISDKPPIAIEYVLLISSHDDFELFSLLERLSTKQFNASSIRVKISISISPDKEQTTIIQIDGLVLDNVATKNFLNRLKTANNLFLHNSTQDQNEYYFRRGHAAFMFELSLSQKDRDTISEAEANLHAKLKKVARDHKAQLKGMLDELNERHDVEFSTVDLSSMSRFFPLTINLSDKNVEVPLTSWGSGTQNRTHILISILKASRIKNREKAESRITPIVLIEEPESFLHPSAQAEFGRVLQSLSEKLSIQIIVSTHSPYMLNQIDPSSNVLLSRKTVRRKSFETRIEDTSGSEWMRPFADHLGLIPDELTHWRDILARRDKKVLLVEGEIDRQYLEFLRRDFPCYFSIPHDIEILPYGGKDTLKNTMALSFMMRVATRAFITFDLDAKSEVRKSLDAIGLRERSNYFAIGVDKSGKRCIEGFLPNRVLQAVYGRETDLVSALHGGTEERKSAKSKLKNLLLDEFRNNNDYADDEMRHFCNLARVISKGIGD